MATIDPSPSSDELQAIAGLFKRTESSLQGYLALANAAGDPNFDALTAAALSLNNVADTIAVMQLHLATDQGLEAVGVINQATSELQHAVIVRNEITHDLNIVSSVVGFGAAIAAGDIGGIVTSGTSLIDTLNGN